MLKVVLDTNVLISAIVFGGIPRKILDLVIDGKIQLCISEAIINEVKSVLSRKKFNYPQKILDKIILELENITVDVEPKIKINLIQNDPDDNIILECAKEINADIIVSGDNDLLSIIYFEGIKILNPKDFLETVLFKNSL